MAEFFLELFSEEVPASLQKNARENILESFKKLFEVEKVITFWLEKTSSLPPKNCFNPTKKLPFFNS